MKHMIMDEKYVNYHNDVSNVGNIAARAFSYKHSQENAIGAENNWWVPSTFALQSNLKLQHKVNGHLLLYNIETQPTFM